MIVLQLSDYKQDPSEQPQEPERVKADINNGYYRVANELGLALCKVTLNSQESRVLNAIKMKTFGFNKSTDWICNEQIAELTGIAKNHVSETKKTLLKRKILVEVGRKIGINKVVSEWINKYKNQPLIPKKGQEVKSLNKDKIIPKQGKGIPKQGLEYPQTGNHIRQDTNTKDTNTKDKLVFGLADLPEFIPKDLWLEFIAMRKSIKKPVTENIAKRMLKKLIDFDQRGINATEALTRTVDNCWADIFEPKNNFAQKNKLNHAKTISPSGWKPATLLPGMEPVQGGDL